MVWQNIFAYPVHDQLPKWLEQIIGRSRALEPSPTAALAVRGPFGVTAARLRRGPIGATAHEA